jgi:hypothetical protein
VGNASTGKSDVVARVAPRDSLTARAVSAASAFEASLSSVQRAAVQYSFNSEKKSGWSYVPTNLVPRNDYDREFLFGLDVILDGLQRLLDEQRR